MKMFRDREEAGRMLAEALRERLVPAQGKETPSLLALAIPRGGVVVGAEVARQLGAPLDVWLARKIGAPSNPELAIGSISSHGELILDHQLIQALGVGQAFIEDGIHRETQELERRMTLFRGHSEPVKVQGKTVVLVDDGVATGSTAVSALAALKRGGAAKRILAIPVAPADTAPKLEMAADECVILSVEEVFYAVGQFYQNFGQVSDEEVIRILSKFSH